jgi:hypothetical protein
MVRFHGRAWGMTHLNLRPSLQSQGAFGLGFSIGFTKLKGGKMASSKKARTADVENKSLSCRVKIITISFAAVALLMMISGCTPHKMYRTEYQVICPSENPKECDRYALQQLPNGIGTNYLLGFIEFDDQGQLWDREQMKRVLSALREKAASQELLIVAFVHGWKHSAAPGDTDIETFRGILTRLSKVEVEKEKTLRTVSANTEGSARQVAGVYLGWRGESIIPDPFKELTFWDRKNTAQKVGHGGIVEVLSQLEDIQTTYKSSLAVIGHSMGSAVLHTALVQILEDRFIQTANPDIKGYGDLVVLINSAYEANLYTPLSDMSTERGNYCKSQRPILAVLTSEADWATRDSFRMGRILSTRFEYEDHDHQRKNAVTGQMETISAYEANVTAIGHFEPYRTHQLDPSHPEQKRVELKPASAERSVDTLMQISDDWRNDAPGKSMTIGEVVLKRTENSAGRNPYLVIRVNENLSSGHNDFADPRIIEFINQLIQISSTSPIQTDQLRRALKPAP